jgi:hypothetical protein
MAHRAAVIVVVSVSLGALTALLSLTALSPWTIWYGSAARWVLPGVALSEGWLVGVITLIALTSDRAPNQRWAATARRLLWWALPVLFLQHILLHVLVHPGWNYWFIFEWLLIFIGLTMVALTPERLHEALQRLRDRDVLPGSADAGDGLERELERIAHRWSLVGRWCALVAMLVAMLVMAGPPSFVTDPTGENSVLWLIAAFVVGGWVGRMAGYGRLSHVLAKRGIQLRVVPGHPDGAGGLEPIGAFYLYQSLVASLPAIWLIIYGVVQVAFGVWRYGVYLPDWYLSSLALAILAEVLVFVVPMLSVHGSMREQRKAFVAKADRLSAAIETTQARLEDPGLEGRDAVNRQLTELVERYHTLEKTPTWPLDRSIRRRITLQNLGLLLPFAGYLVGNTPFWDRVSEVFKGLG